MPNLMMVTILSRVLQMDIMWVQIKILTTKLRVVILMITKRKERKERKEKKEQKEKQPKVAKQVERFQHLNMSLFCNP